MGVALDSIRECGVCGKTKQLVAFATFRSSAGEKRRRGVCKECREGQSSADAGALRAYRKQYNADNASVRHKKQAARRVEARAVVDAYKAVRPCADCGRSFPPVAMDLDHARGGKVRCVSSLVSGAYKLYLIIAEIAKCDVVCACCHRVRTAARGENRCRPRFKAARSPGISLAAKPITFAGETLSINAWARKFGLSPQTVSSRLRRGYSIEDALAAHSYTSGTSPVYVPRTGEACVHAKLTWVVVRAIRAARASGETQAVIGARYGIAQGRVSDIVLQKVWKEAA
jgi:hypothetical protein